MGNDTKQTTKPKSCPFCGNKQPMAPVSILGRWMVECGAPCGGAVRDYATAADAHLADAIGWAALVEG